jgi:vancomycin permeability regulator SanA
MWTLRVGMLAIAGMIAACLAITFAGLDDDLHVADLAVVPGSKVNPDGQPSEALQARLDRAAELYRLGYFKVILVSGAHGREGYDEPAVMARYLEVHGIPNAAIFQDNKGYKTWQTAQNTAAFMNAHHLKSVLIISQYFHLPRCRLAFSKFGIAPIYTSHARYWSMRDFYSLPREVIGCIAYDLRRPKPVDSTPRT